MARASTATLAYVLLFLASLALTANKFERNHLGGYVACVIAAPLTYVSSIVGANIGALVMTRILEKPLMYFRKEWWCVPLYGAPAVLGK